MAIKLIALDIDGTTLKKGGVLSPANRKAITGALDLGVYIVIATGRCHDALPQALLEIPGIRYALTSNGAQTRDLATGETIDGNYIRPSAVDESIALLGQYPELMLEYFTDGRAYMEQDQYDKILSGEISFRNREYVRETRNPMAGLLGHMAEHRETVENINIFFETAPDKQWLKPHLDRLSHVTITSSFDNNWEIGGENTSKGAGLTRLAAMLGIRREEIMACGDSPNDEEMLKAAGTPVAVGNAKESVKALAVYLAPSNEEDGVADAIRKFVI